MQALLWVPGLQGKVPDFMELTVHGQRQKISKIIPWVIRISESDVSYGKKIPIKHGKGSRVIAAGIFCKVVWESQSEKIKSSKGLNEWRERVGTSGESTFQVAGTADAKALRQEWAWHV